MQEMMRKQMEEIRSALNQIDQDHEALETILKGYESWFRANPETGTDVGGVEPPHYPPSLLHRYPRKIRDGTRNY